jgi:hypothetical protein
VWEYKFKTGARAGETRLKEFIYTKLGPDDDGMGLVYCRVTLEREEYQQREKPRL